MATLPIYNTVPDVRGYQSKRVYDGFRQLSDKSAKQHRARLMRALKKQGC